ncbi:hypothetical protein A4A49_60393, partial [Nicotiana attenuata]
LQYPRSGDMATAPPSTGGKPPDQRQKMRLSKANTVQQISLKNSNPAATNLKNGDAITIANNRLGASENSQLNSGPNIIISNQGDSSPSPGATPLQKSTDSTVGITPNDLLKNEDSLEVAGNGVLTGQIENAWYQKMRKEENNNIEPSILYWYQSTASILQSLHPINSIPSGGRQYATLPSGPIGMLQPTSKVPTLPKEQEIDSKSSNQILIEPILSNTKNGNLADLTSIGVRPNASVISVTPIDKTTNVAPHSNPMDVSCHVSIQEVPQKESDHTMSQPLDPHLTTTDALAASLVQSQVKGTLLPMKTPQVLLLSIINNTRHEVEISPIQFTTPVITAKQGKPAVIFKKEDYMVKFADICKFTVVGKFQHTMPRMEIIRKSFIAQTELRGGVKIVHFNARTVYIDLDNEYDHSTLWSEQNMYIQGQLMRIEAWNPIFKPNEDSPIVPIWIMIPELPWHLYYMEILTPLLSPICKALFLDLASFQKTRDSMVKIKQIDLTKERPTHVWLGYDEDQDVNGDGQWLEVQYDNLPSYCSHCRHLVTADVAVKDSAAQNPVTQSQSSPVALSAKEVKGGREVCQEKPSVTQDGVPTGDEYRPIESEDEIDGNQEVDRDSSDEYLEKEKHFLEPFLDTSPINFFILQLSMHQAASNVNDKMWVFWDKEFNASVTDHDEQQLTLEMRHVEYDSPFFLIVVYAKCKPILGRPLWEVLRHKSATYDSPWCVIGDFNVIASVEEKIGGIPYQMNKSLDFHCMIEDCGLVDLGFYGPKCTWSNGRGQCSIVWKRLDRGLSND